MMNIRELKYLVALSELRHFGKAANVCYVTQPALSMQIKKFEKYLGVQLIERTNKLVLLTETGEALAKQAMNILTQISEMRETAKLLRDPYSGELKIGIIPTLAPYLLPNIIPIFSKLFPNLMIYLAEEQTNCLLEKLRQGKLDAVILAPPIKEIGFVTTQLFKEEFMLIVPKIHPFAKRKSIKQKELEHERILTFEDGHCMLEQAFTLCHIMNAAEPKNFRATSLETLHHMVATGVGITLIPKLACKTNSTVTYIPFSSPKPIRRVGILWRTSTAKKVLLEEIARLVRKIMSKQIRQTNG